MMQIQTTARKRVAKATKTPLLWRALPSETLWLTVHRDLRQTPRVRVLFDFLVAAVRTDRELLAGA